MVTDFCGRIGAKAWDGAGELGSQQKICSKDRARTKSTKTVQSIARGESGRQEGGGLEKEVVDVDVGVKKKKGIRERSIARNSLGKNGRAVDLLPFCGRQDMIWACFQEGRTNNTSDDDYGGCNWQGGGGGGGRRGR